nr:hypothetical protein BaRGS_028774 [Batillaria attramentaria]
MSRVRSLTLNDVPGNLTVDALDNVTLRCATTGRPKPSIRVVRVDTGQPLEVDTSHTSGQDENVQQYTLTTSARCQDAAIYRCEASNDKGADQKSVKLFVNCSPRLPNEGQGLGSSANPSIISDAGFSIAAFPVPSVKEVVFLGTASAETDPSTDSGQSSTALIADCQPDGLLLYMSRCSVSVKNGATAENGIYRLSVNNAFGSVDVYVKLDLTEEESLEQSQGVPTAAIAGGVAAAVVVIIVIVTVGVIFLRKKRTLYIVSETTKFN